MKNVIRKKWRNIHELCKLIDEDDCLWNCGKELKLISYAPNIGYRSWIFKYKGTLVALFDAGNSHYEFHTAVTYLDVIGAFIGKYLDHIEFKRMNFSKRCKTK